MAVTFGSFRSQKQCQKHLENIKKHNKNILKTYRKQVTKNVVRGAGFGRVFLVTKTGFFVHFSFHMFSPVFSCFHAKTRKHCFWFS